MKKKVVASLAVLTAMILIVGCAPRETVRPQASIVENGSQTFDDLVKNSDKYFIYAFEFNQKPASLLFDPKDDDKVVQVSDQWKKIGNAMELQRAIEMSQFLRMHAIPALYAIRGSDGKIWAYLGSYVTQVNVRYINDNTIEVSEPKPPVRY